MPRGTDRLTRFGVALETEGITATRLTIGVAGKALAYAGGVFAIVFAIAGSWEPFAVALAVFLVGAAGWSLAALSMARNGTLTWREAMQCIRYVPTWTLLELFV